jgi:two-component system, cell cycle sensor histidine kinase and response regulator CckA
MMLELRPGDRRPEPAPSARLREEGTGRLRAESKPIGILLIEDTAEDALLMSALLEASRPGGFRLDAVESLAAAVERLDRRDIDAIILDLNLPDSHGLETLERLQTRFPTIPVLILTSVQDEALADKAIRMGAQDYLIKGKVDSSLLVRAVRYSIERKRTESALRMSEERFELMARATNDAVWDWDLVQNRIWWNVGVRSFLGYPPDHLGTDLDWWHAHIHPEDRARVISCIRSVIDGGGRFWLDEYRYLCADGTYACVFDRGYVIHDDRGTPIRMIGAMMDITDRKRAEEALRDTNETLRTLIQASPVGIAVMDAERKVRIWNPAAERILGWKAAEILGRPLPPMAGPGQKDGFAALTARAFRGEAITGEEFRSRRRDGATVDVSVSMAPVREARGSIGGAMAVIADVSERKVAEDQKTQLEEQLRQSQKMEAIGKLAGGIAHDFNNLLTAVSGYATLLQGGFEAADPGRVYTDEILKSSNRATTLTRQLLAFSRRQVLQPRVLDLNGVVRGVDGLLRRLIGEDIELRTVLDPALGSVKADQGQVEQIIVNLAVNARDAMPKGGVLTIATRNVELGDEYVQAHGRNRRGSHVVLSVSDTGCGMSPQTQSHLFEPFFTTKEQGKGTGLGLATVYGIVKQSEGDIWVYSEVDKGSDFKIYLPRVDEAPDAPPRDLTRLRPRKGKETVLLAEDAEFVRRLSREILTRHGYTVLEAADGEEALQRCLEYAGPIHLLVTDMVMPRMSGRELVSHLAGRRPEMKILYMSGYTEEAIATHGVFDPGAAFLEKPFPPDALARKVREVLDAGRSPSIEPPPRAGEETAS